MNKLSNAKQMLGGAFEAPSRRGFFGFGIKAVGAGMMAISVGAQTVVQPITDVNVLNYALTLENLEASFYIQALSRFTAANFAASNFQQNFGTGVNSNVYTYLQNIRDHEITHVQTLTQVIQSLGGTPVGPGVYNFSFGAPDNIIQTAALLENTGVSAYDGAINLLSSPALVQAGATIATVEARHAAYLNFLNSAIPFPSAYDQARTMQDILAAASAFIVAPTGGTPIPGTPATTPGANVTTAVISPTTLTTSQNQVALDLSKSTSANGGPLSYSVSVSPGTASVLLNGTNAPVIQFNAPNTYTVSVTVTDAAGTSATTSATIVYTGPPSGSRS